MDPDAQTYSTHHGMQKRDTKIFLEKFVPRMKWDDGNEILMDVGCGPGNSTVGIILPSLPPVKSVIAVDLLPSMIKFAKAQNAHPKISYHVADISDESTLKEWFGKITKAVSIYCFNLLQDQRMGFKNLFNVLREDAEAILLFGISSPFWDGHIDLVNSPKWKPYIQNVKPRIPESNANRYGSQYYQKMLEEIGFTVLACEEENNIYSYENDVHAKESVASRCDFTAHIPMQLKEDFKDDLFKMFLKFNGRDAAGRPEVQYTSISLHLKKPFKIT